MELPVVLHRPLPEHGAIKAAQVVRRRVGSHFVYALLLTVHTDSVEEGSADGPIAAIALGWERREDGLRVAVCLGSDGSHDELVLPNRLFDRFQTLDRLRSIRAREHRKAAEEITTWGATCLAELPRRLTEA
ncbi:MAG: hypothetical protein M0Z66_15555 [Thermaerobacter sp.]|nr:hypothetical protein [Thermaerobacter sp.]